MRKTLNINLGGMAFVMDENAYELLHGYLEALKQKFSNEEEREEILNDIEARIAEMLSHKLANRKEVVSIEEVQLVMDAMGRPEDIAGEEPPTDQPSAKRSTTTSAGAPVKKRLFRDPDDAKIGGVIAGLCHYFGINDPVWIRIAAIILIFVTSGSIILLYLLLLIVVPKASTAAEKLQMKGEPINISTIQKEVKEAAVRGGESVQKFVREENFFEKVWGILADLIKVVFKLFAIVVIVASMIGLIAVSAGFLGFYILGSSWMIDASRLVVDHPSTITMFSFGFLFFFLAPLIALIYLCLKVLVGQRSRVRSLKWILLVAWITGLVLLVISGYKTGIQFANEATRKEQVSLMQPPKGALMVQLTDELGNKYESESGSSEDFQINPDGVYINGVNLRDLEEIPLGKPKLELMPAEGDSFYLQEITTAHGRDRREAERNAAIVIYKFNQTDTVLNLQKGLYIGKQGKFRDQRLTIRLAIPEGKTVRFADNIDHWSAVVKDDRRYDDTYFANTVWTVKEGRVKCIEGENHSREDISNEEDSGQDNRPQKKIKTRVKVKGGKDSDKEDF